VGPILALIAPSPLKISKISKNFKISKISKKIKMFIRLVVTM
jgi:hypothetical protein